MEIEKVNYFRSDLLSEKEKRNITLFELIRKKGPISRTEISNISGINTVSVSHYIKNFLDKKLVLEKGFDISSGGRKPELLELNTKINRTVGIDIGSGAIRVTILDLSGNIVAKEITQAPVKSATEAASRIISLLDEMVKKSGISAAAAIKAIGVGVPRNDLAPVAGMLEQHFGVDSFAGDHAFCAAFGEKERGVYSDTKDILYLHSDLGSGVIIKSDSILGYPAYEDGPSGQEAPDMSRQAPADALYYLQKWGQAFGMEHIAKIEAAKGVGTNMVSLASGKIENISARTVIEAAGKNDQLAREIVRRSATNLGIRVAYLINLFSPEVIIMGGGLEAAGEMVLGPVKNVTKKFVLSKSADKVKIVSGILKEDVVSIGSGLLAVREMILKA